MIRNTDVSLQSHTVIWMTERWGSVFLCRESALSCNVPTHTPQSNTSLSFQIIRKWSSVLQPSSKRFVSVSCPVSLTFVPFVFVCVVFDRRNIRFGIRLAYLFFNLPFTIHPAAANANMFSLKVSNNLPQEYSLGILYSFICCVRFTAAFLFLSEVYTEASC